MDDLELQQWIYDRVYDRSWVDQIQKATNDLARERNEAQRKLAETQAELKRLQDKYEPKQEPVFDFDRHYKKISNFEGLTWLR